MSGSLRHHVPGPERLKLSIKHADIPQATGDNLDRPEGMTDHELRLFSCYGQKFETNEKLVWNDLYGHAGILKTYSHFGGPLDGVVPHGVYSPFIGMSGMELDTGLPRAYSWLPYMDCYYREQGKLEVHPIASPFIYAMTILGYDPSRTGQGTLFIPYHSTDVWDFDDDWYHIMLQLRKSSYPGPVAVMMFFEDVRKGRHRIFQKKGIPVYTCGDKFRPEFLYQFIHVARHFEHVLVNDVSSPAFYAAYMGKKVMTHGESGVRYADNQAPWSGHSPNSKAFPDSVYETFTSSCPEQLTLAREVLRECALQSPEQMFTMFSGDERGYCDSPEERERELHREIEEWKGHGDVPEPQGCAEAPAGSGDVQGHEEGEVA